ncbi:putative glycosyltransferase EpsJ [Methanobrevibacter cuticularis]|uniref:Putative glycosyltransferase EpsJ n=1 Tax=Methanobrevibacter cuticularis TaxID=47311 RepID=A0A166DZS3_9EURY|nr:glycosyltransferase [Methanobrevibacter cuticularis]KZX16125.1 putative glycosyltransferase EpsJ [Methanobrevibacter cuticularis]
MPKISVILPIYNVESYLKETLNSIINQTLEEIEIICINDGSTDNSLKILEEYAKKDKRFIILNQENSGAGVARNKGLKISKGEYLSFLDGDDIFELDMLEKAYAKSKKLSLDLLNFGVNDFNEDLSDSKRIPHDINKKYLPKKEVFNYKDFPKYVFNTFQNWTWNKLFKREFILKNNIKFQEIHRTNDLLFTSKALIKAKRISILDIPLINYRRNVNSCQSTNHLYPKDFYYAFLELKNFLISEDLFDLLKQSFVNFAVSGCLHNLTSLKTRESYRELYVFLHENGLKDLSITEAPANYFYEKRYLKIKDVEKYSLIKSSNQPKVSIVVPIYNVEDYLKVALDSLVNQTLRDIEIICVNDGSTDKSSKIIEEYATRDERIKIVSKTNSGYGHSMNIGMELAKGEYIGILEPDDYVALKMYETLYEKAMKYDLDFIKSDFRNFRDEKENRIFKYSNLAETEYYNCIINPQKDFEAFKFDKQTWSGIYKRNFLTKHDIKHNETPGASFQDNGFWFQTFCFAEKIMILDKAFYFYRKDNPNQSTTNKEKVFIIFKEWKFIKNKLNELLSSSNDLKSVYEYCKYKSYIFHYRRVGSKFKKDFLKRFHEEFVLADKEGNLSKNYFSPANWYLLNLIINNPSEFYKVYSTNQPNYKKMLKSLSFIIKKEWKHPKRIINLLKAYKNIKKLNLFDGAYYTKKYPEAYSSKYNPIDYYMFYGYKKNHIPSKKFDSLYYLKRYSDVRKNGENPLLHYVLYGQKEGRISTKKKDSDYKINEVNKKINTQNKLFSIIFRDCTVETNNSLKLIQKFSLEFLKFIDKICEKYEIDYWLNKSNLIGAIHNKGYFPWDDGIDIGMMRKDYDKFISIIEKEIQSNELEDIIKPIRNYGQVCSYEWGEITTYLKFNYLLKDGIGFIDVLPYDYIKKNKDEEDIEGIRDLEVGKYRKSIEKNNIYNNIANDSIHLSNNEKNILKKSMKNLNLKVERSDYVIPGVDADDEFCIIPKNNIFPLSSIEFENYKFKCPFNPQKFLNSEYGESLNDLSEIVKFHCKDDEYYNSSNINILMLEQHVKKLRDVNNKDERF